MLLKDFNNLWGIPLDSVRKQGRRYNIYTILIYILDIFAMLICGAFMYRSGTSFNMCVTITFLIAVICFMTLALVRNPEKWRAYVFYKKFKKKEVIEVTLFVKEASMKSILYCANYKRVKMVDSVSACQDAMLSACREDSIYSKRLGTLLSKFTLNDEGTVEIKAYFIKHGKKCYLISFEEV